MRSFDEVGRQGTGECRHELYTVWQGNEQHKTSKATQKIILNTITSQRLLPKWTWVADLPTSRPFNVQSTLDFKVPLLQYVVRYALPDLADRYCHVSVRTNISKYMKQSLCEASGHTTSQEKPTLLRKIKNFSTTLHNSLSSDSIQTLILSMMYYII